MTLYVAPRLKKFLLKHIELNEEFTRADLIDELDMFFSLKDMGIVCSFEEDHLLKQAFDAFDKWEKITKQLWHKTKNADDDTSIVSIIKLLNEELYAIDEEIFRDNDQIPALERKMACWAALKTALHLLMLDINAYIASSESKASATALLNMLNGKEAATVHKTMPYYKKVIRRCVEVISAINIVVGTKDDCSEIFYTLRGKPIVLVHFYDAIDDQFRLLKKSPVASSLCTKLMEQSYTHDFLGMLVTRSRTGNFIIDAVHNDKTNEFISSLENGEI